MVESFPSRIRATLGACLFALPLIASARSHASCLEIQSPSVDFGTVWIGQEGRTSMLVRNTCERTLTISKISVSKPVFRAVTTTPLNLAGMTSAWVEFGLLTQSRGPVSGTACLYSNAGARPACVSLTGTGIVPPTMTVSPTSLRATQAAGTKGSVSLQIANSDAGNIMMLFK